MKQGRACQQLAAAMLGAGITTTCGCGGTLAGIEPIASELDAMSQGLTASHPETFRSILGNALAIDAYVCMPLPREVFFGSPPGGQRVIAGSMPHYGLYYGPIHYRIRRLPDQWRVTLKLVVEPPDPSEILELPDCALHDRMHGEQHCSGIPFVQAPDRDACPSVGVFRARATPHNVHELLRRWSTEAEAYYNRDAAAFGIPVTYDFEVTTEPAPDADWAMPLKPTCARTPYYTGLRSGWSMPVVSHELGHFLGLMDEYEMFSGIVGFYPKTPYPGAEVSRMGLSMKEHTRLLPIHHYLVLRRFFCPEPVRTDPYGYAP